MDELDTISRIDDMNEEQESIMGKKVAPKAVLIPPVNESKTINHAAIVVAKDDLDQNNVKRKIMFYKEDESGPAAGDRIDSDGGGGILMDEGEVVFQQ